MTRKTKLTIGVVALTSAALLAVVVCCSGLVLGTRGRSAHYAGGGSFGGGLSSAGCRGDLIVFSSPRSGKGDIYSIRIDGSNRTQLTNDPNYEGDAALSYDGSKIAFVREHWGVGQIWVMNADGSGQRQLTSGNEYDTCPSFSPDGARIVFTRLVDYWTFGDNPTAAETFVMNVDGSGLTRLTHNLVADGNPCFSPDGKSILYHVWARDFWLMGSDGSSPKKLADGASAAFSPDGKRILFTPGPWGAQSISILDLEDMKTTEVITTGSYKSGPSFCLNGSAILFLDEPKGRGVGNLTILSLDSGKTRIVGSTGE